MLLIKKPQLNIISFRSERSAFVAIREASFTSQCPSELNPHKSGRIWWCRLQTDISGPTYTRAVVIIVLKSHVGHQSGLISFSYTPCSPVPLNWFFTWGAWCSCDVMIASVSHWFNVGTWNPYTNCHKPKIKLTEIVISLQRYTFVINAQWFYQPPSLHKKMLTENSPRLLPIMGLWHLG